MPQKPRISVLHTGGTIAMHDMGDGVLTPGTYAQDLVRELPVISRLAEFDTTVLSNIDSGDMQPDDWQRLAKAVHAELSRPEISGVVILHGTDTMAYTASALGLMLGPLPKPVILTGAQRPLAEVRTDARANVVDACLLATMPVPEVGVAFASRLWRGVRVTKRDAWALDAFGSPAVGPLVDLGISEAIGDHVRSVCPLLPLDDRIDTRVLAVRVFPGFDPNALRRALMAGLRGLVLEGYGTGNLPSRAGSLIPVLEEARERGVPVLVVSQCLRGHVDLARYTGGALAAAAGAISGGDMTVEAAVAKMMIATGRYSNVEQIRAFLQADIIGERSS